MKQVELLLTENVEHLGIVGDVVRVKPGYARNYLLPRGLATTPSPKAIEKLAERRKQVEAEIARERAELEALHERLQGAEITLERSANEQGVLFGGVSSADVGEALREAGYGVQDKAVRISDRIQRLDSYEVPIVLAADLQTNIKLWVVSDRPADQLETGEEGEAEDEGEAEAGAAAGEASGEAT